MDARAPSCWSRQIAGPRIDASELFDVASWGKGYFSVNEEGHVLVHPEKDPARADRSQETHRHAGAARHLAADSDPLRRDPEAPAAGTSRRLRRRHSRAQIQRQLLLRLSDQGESAAAGGRRSSRVRQAVQVRHGSGLQAGAAGRDGALRQRHADHLQRIQGRRIYRDGDAGPEDRAADHSRRRKIHRARADPEILRSESACGPPSAFAPSWPAAVRAAGNPPAAIARSSA